LIFLALTSFCKSYGQSCTIAGNSEVCDHTIETYYVTYSETAFTSYSWSLTGGGVILGDINLDSVSVSWNYSGPYGVQCDVFESGTFVTSCFFNVNVFPKPIKYLLEIEPQGWYSGELKNFCVGDTVTATLVDYSGENNSNFQYTWHVTGAGTNYSAESNQAFIEFIIEGEVAICVDIEIGNCSYTYCEDVQVHLTPDSVSFEIVAADTFNGSNTLCSSQDIYFMNTTPGDFANTTWLWTVYNGINTWTYHTRDLLFQFIDPGSYDITLQFSPYNGCSSDPITKTVEIEDLLPLPIGCPTTICFGDTAWYVVQTDCDSVKWEVSEEGSVLYQSGDSIQITWNNITGNDYGYIVVNGFGCDSQYCSSPSVVTVPLFPPDMVKIGEPTMICGNGISWYDELTPTPPGASYQWSLTKLDSLGGTVSLVNSTSERCYISVTDFIGVVQLDVEVSHPSLECVAFDTILVDIYGVSLRLPNSICYGSSLNANIKPPMDLNVRWEIYYEGSLVHVLTDDDSISISSEIISIPGAYTINAQILDSIQQPCGLEAVFTVNAPVTPIEEIHGSVKICPGQNEYYWVDGAEGVVHWSIQGGVFVPSSQPITGLMREVMWDDTSSVKSISAWRKVGSCYSDTITLFVEEYNVSDIMIFGDTTACSDGMSTFTVSFDGADNFIWSIDPPEIGSILPGEDSSEIIILWHYTPIPVDVTVSVIADDCFSSGMDATLNILVTPFDFQIVGDSIACAGDTLTFTSTALSASEWTWFINGDTAGNASQMTNIFDEPGQYLIELQSYSPNGCGADFLASHLVIVQGFNAPLLFADTIVQCPIDSTFSASLLTNYSSEGNYTFMWYLDNILLSGETNPILNITELGTYMVEVSDGICSRSAELVVLCDSISECQCDTAIEVSILEVDAHQFDCGRYSIEGDIMEFTNANPRYWRVPNVNGIGYRTLPIDVVGDLIKTNLLVEMPGLYQISLTGVCKSDGEQCPVRANDFLTIPLTTGIEYEIDCIGDGSTYYITIHDNSLLLATAQIDSREWLLNSVPFSDSLELSLIANAGDTIPVSLTLVDSSGYSCQKSINIFVPQQPELSFTTGFEGGCAQTISTFYPVLDSLAGNLAGLLWDFGDNSQSELINPVKVYAGTGMFEVTLIAETSFGCTVSVSDTVEIVENEIGGEIISLGQTCDASVILGFDQETGGTIVDYHWMPTNDTTSTINAMQADMFTLQVWDENGCTFITDPFMVSIVEPFDFSCLPMEASKCQGTGAYKLDECVNSEYKAMWYAIPNYTDTLSFPVSIGTAITGTYTIYLLAVDPVTKETCAEYSFVLNVNPSPSISLQTTLVSCDPFLAEVYETADQIVNWTNTNFPASSSIMVTDAKSYSAKITNEFGCFDDASVAVRDLLDVSAFDAGCRTECLDDIIAGLVIVNGIPDTFDYWEWRLNGSAVDFGTGAVDPLTITSLLIGNISLYVVRDSCSKETGNHYIEAIQCGNCPDSLIVAASTHELMPVFGDADCDEYVYYVEGTYIIPQGYIFCDSIPVFEGGYFVYDEFNYPLDPTYTTVNFSGHLYVTDMAAYMSNPGLVGEFMICDDSTGAMCPAKVTIQYRAPMNGMMCNFTHCLNCISCNNTFGQNVPVKSCMTLQFPTCYDDCDVNEYVLNIIKPDLTNPITLYSDTIVWDSNGINQDYCFEYILKYYHPTSPCYLVELESNCGHYCLSSICLDDLVPCYSIAPLQQGSKPTTLLQNELEVFPNPNNGDLVYLKAGNVTSGEAHVTIYSFDGAIAVSEDVSFNGQNASIQTNKLIQGIYVITVQDKTTGMRSTTRYVHMD